jgi:glycogenin glucosyltransferase
MKLEERTPEQLAQEDSVRRQNWEQGNIDYMGRDSFDNIWSKISQTIGKVEPTVTESSVSPVAETPSVPSESSVPVSTAVPAHRVAEVEHVADQPAADKSTPSVTDEPPACLLPSKEQSKLASEPVSTTSQPAPATSEATPQEATVDPVTEPISETVAPEPVLASTLAEIAPVPKPTPAEEAEVCSKLAAASSSPAETSPPTETSSSLAAEISQTEKPAESAPTSQSPGSSSNEL